MARLVIVSNRVASPRERVARAGGLAVALHSTLERYGGIWFGWSGEIAETSSMSPRLVSAGEVTYATVDLSRADHQEYYVDFANGTLWPLLHYRLGLIEYKRRAFERYREVNRYLARMLCPLLRPDDLIWIHDYHLIPLGAALRDLGVANRIGFFLHTPFPPPEVLIALPHHETLMRTLCAYDLVGFQTDEGVRAFLNYITGMAGGRNVGDGWFSVYGVRSRAGAFPISIDTDRFVALANRAVATSETRRLRESLAKRDLIIGVDRLDYSKGLPNRFEACRTGPTTAVRSPTSKSRRIRAARSRNTARCAASWKRPPAASTANSRSSTGRRSATPTGACRGKHWLDFTAPPGSGW